MSKGIVYYNRGLGCIVRLAVSIHSLRKVYDGPICIMAHKDKGFEYCQDIMGHFADMGEFTVKQVDFPEVDRRGQTYLNACLTHTATPYETSIWVDADTLALRPFAEAWWTAAEQFEFAIAQIADWRVSRDDGTATSIGNRVLSIAEVHPDLMREALAYPAAINCGVFSFVKSSKLMRDWYGMAEKCVGYIWIPDEVCCQAMLPIYPHHLMPHWYNVSCKYDNPYDENAKLVHYHGRKHCRIEKGVYKNKSRLWYDAFDEIREWRSVRECIQHDRQLKKYLPVHDWLRK